MQFVEALVCLEIFEIKYCAEFSLIFYGTAKVRLCNKTRETVNFLPLINNSVSIALSFLLLSISAIISSNTIKILHSLFRPYSSIFL